MAAPALHKNASLLSLVGTGVITGDKLITLYRYARDNNFAIPAVNCIGSSSVVGVLEAARTAQSPVIIQFSEGGAHFFGGKGLDNKKQEASIAGSIAAAHYVRSIAKQYGVPVVLHSDHCAKKLLPWFEGMIRADEAYFAEHGEPLYSSHMLDLSEETLEENIKICKQYMTRMDKINCFLEMELGITGGEEDGVNNEHVDNSKMYSQPAEIYKVYTELSAISHRFSVAAAFGNVHGVYAPGNVKLRPEILGNAQKFVQEQAKLSLAKPIFFVFHGGSGSDKADIKTAIQNGVVKMNIDTDTQWAFWEGVRKFEKKNRDYLQGQIGNPKGKDKPNKKFYDPRVWLREGEKELVNRVHEALRDLDSYGVLARPVYLVAKL